VQGTTLAPAWHVGSGEHSEYGVGHIVQTRLQLLKLAHTEVAATPHAEGGEQQAIYHSAEFHNVYYFCLCRKSSKKRAKNMKLVSIHYSE
jgi:hypothetical protein